MSEYATEIRIRFYDDIGTFKVEELFKALQNLTYELKTIEGTKRLEKKGRK